MKKVTLIIETPDDEVEVDQRLRDIREFVERSAKWRVTLCHIRPERSAPPEAEPASGADTIRDLIETL